jgi:hypothetical protein
MKDIERSARPNFLRVIGKQGLEALLSVLVVLIFFAAFLWLLGLLFPSGGGIGDMVRREQRATGNLAGRTLSELLTSQEGGRKSSVAVLADVHNTVSSRRSNEISWSPAPDGMNLFDRDAVQTAQRSYALLDFGEQATLNVGENSLVIVNRQAKNPDLPEQKEVVLMMDGELRGKFSGTAAEGMQIVVATPRAVTRVTGNGAEFKVTVNPDQSSTIAVYQGVADVVTEGNAVSIGSNMAVVVGADRSISAPRSLPPRPVPLTPPDANGYLYRDLSPRISFAWSGPPGAKAYHLVLARDPAFRDVFVDEKVSRTEFTHGKLTKGTYYWRVSTLENGLEGPFSVTRKVRLTQKKESPALVVNFPPATVTGSSFDLIGNTDPGVRIFISGREVRTSAQGEFRSTIILKRGVNIIVVEAVDSVGNVSYRSCTVHGKF